MKTVKTYRPLFHTYKIFVELSNSFESFKHNFFILHA